MHVFRSIPAAACILQLLASSTGINAETYHLTGPDGALGVSVSTDSGSRLTYSISRAGSPLVNPSALGITVDGRDLGSGAELGPLEQHPIHDSYPRLGGKSQTTLDAIVYEITVNQPSAAIAWILEFRVFEGGVGYRYRIPGDGLRRIEGESSTWRLPAGAKVWYQTNTSNYEGVYRRSRLEELASTAGNSEYIGCPLTAQLPGGTYVLITEAALFDYSGMTLQPEANGTLRAVFQDDPEGWEVRGPLVSPWRVTIAAPDLNALANSDLISHLGDPPDPDLFPDGSRTAWIEPGKALITWTVFGNDGAQWYRQKWFIDHCASLGCEYLLVDAGWRTERWGWLREGGDIWNRLAELCAYGDRRNVGIFVWHAYPEGRDDGPGLTNPERRREFFRRCRQAGVRGVKIDFFDSESRAVVEDYENLLRLAAENHLMINFHGANKPTGESRTWPNEITREGIREQEYLLWDQLPLSHYGALPFTRLVAGAGDFLPTYVRPQYLKNTTAVFQLGTAVVFLSPFLCWPDHPEAYLASPFLSLIRRMPTVWDETIVLPGSQIGSLVAMARRSGEEWFVAVLNCESTDRNFTFSPAFLTADTYSVTTYRDAPGPRTAFAIEAGSTTTPDQPIHISMKGGGGFAAHLQPVSE